MIHALKYASHQSLATPLGALLREAGADILVGADACVPVPLHWRRHWSRGFNQSWLLAEALGLPVWAPLRRRRRTASQAALPAATRRQNVSGAFAPAQGFSLIPGRLSWRQTRIGRPATLVAGATIVLVDDVFTTGATLGACASTLRSMGAAQVRALTLARVVAPGP